ncbi:hypothetical protein GH714_044060 [Hevea brasiliensis]|uniref:Retrotransposon gag domain-containing protein n=1 Tax=Hevea brasiliensis TaxID=3981 RepID=A0A6A6K4K2_HEVBR|nr:hypothetical protein GH714_044060 [Hevea brasiliensis]
MVWWRRRLLDIERGTCTISTWDDFKKELKKQFYPENAAHEARAKLRRLSHKGNIREYVKEFMETLLRSRTTQTRKLSLPSLMACRIGQGAKGIQVQERRGTREAPAMAEMEAIDRTSRRKGTTRFRRKTKVCNALLFRAFCDGPHRARECPKKSRLSALIEEREEDPRPKERQP